MALKDEIITKVENILDTKFETEDVSYIPDLDDVKLTFGNKGLKFYAAVLYIDMRGSTKLLNSHNNNVVAKIFMSYYHIILKIAKSSGGEVRSFNGDSLLVFYYGNTKEAIQKATKSAMNMKYMLSIDENSLNKKLEKRSYNTIDYGIGIDHGDILCTKVGVQGSNNRDLIWMGNAVNKAVVISDKRESIYNIGISSKVYENLSDKEKYSTKNNQKAEMWIKDTITYNEKSETAYKTSYHWSI